MHHSFGYVNMRGKSASPKNVWGLTSFRNLAGPEIPPFETAGFRELDCCDFELGFQTHRCCELCSSSAVVMQLGHHAISGDYI